MNKIAIYTAITGQHTTLKSTIEIPGVDWVAFLDGPTTVTSLSSSTSPDRWRAELLPERFAHPRMDAKWARMNPEFLLPQYETTIWVDGSIQITNGHFVEWVMDFVERSSYGFALFPHPERANIYDECEVSLTHRKYAGEPMREQVENYRSKGLPDDHGLWATGILGRRKNPVLASINQQWMNECIRWSWQDQLSLPWVLWKHRAWHPLDYKPTALQGNIYDCPFFSREWTGPDR